MSSSRRAASLLWFPFFFVVVLGLVGLFAFADPTPSGAPIGVVGSPGAAQQVADRLSAVQPGGYLVRPFTDTGAAEAAMRTGDVVAAYVPGHPARALLAPASSAIRANDVYATLSAVDPGAPTARVAVVPTAPGDVSGIGLMFVGLPLLLVGLITGLLLLQFATWSFRARLVTVAATGAFASVFTYLLAEQMSVLPNDEWLLLWGFLLTQTIGWIVIGVAPFVKQFLLPVAMTFVVVLQLPTGGATVPGDMLPPVLRFLNAVMPFAQYVDLARSSAYFGGAHLLKPLLTLLAWAVAGAGLIVAAALVRRRRLAEVRSEVQAEGARDATSPMTAPVLGTVRTPSGAPVAGATVVLLDAHDAEPDRTISDADGAWRLDDVHAGLRRLAVTGPHIEPVALSVAVRPGDRQPDRDVEVVDLTDPAGNLVADDVLEHDALAGLDAVR